MNIFMIFFLSVALAGGKMPACENHSKKCFIEAFAKLEKGYCVKQCRKSIQEFSDNNKAVLKMFDKMAAHLEEFSKDDTEFLLKGMSFAAEKHQGQCRKDEAKTPYIIHPIGVASTLFEEGNIRDKEVLVAAFIHDTLEDTDTTVEELEKLFGSKVRSIVEEVTIDPNLTTEENKQRQVDHAPTMSQEARLVKLADRLYNVRDLKTANFDKEKIIAYLEWGQKLHDALQGTNSDLEWALQTEITTALAH